MARISITKACERLLEHDEILFLCHIYPDGDTIGSAFALCRVMLDLGKKASVLLRRNHYAVLEENAIF